MHANARLCVYDVGMHPCDECRCMHTMCAEPLFPGHPRMCSQPRQRVRGGPLSVQAHKLVWSEPPVGLRLRTSPPRVVCITNTLITGQHMLIIHETAFATN